MQSILEPHNTGLNLRIMLLNNVIYYTLIKATVGEYVDLLIIKYRPL